MGIGNLHDMPLGVVLTVVRVHPTSARGSLAEGDQVIRVGDRRLKAIGRVPRAWLARTWAYRYNPDDNSVSETSLNSQNLYQVLEGESEWE